MSLLPVDDQPGLWADPAWQPGSCGTFAVVIGISAYRHLAGGTEPQAQTFGLGQLAVSALTAFEVFRWLRDGYRVEGCPVAKVWLLLAPSAAELAHQPELDRHRRAPTLADCDFALRSWRAAMRELPSAAAEGSRALFFFSGHGLELHQEQQILLPEDYLAPPEPNFNAAIGTDNLKKGLAALRVPHQVFFLDACRNDHHELRARVVTGRQILTEEPAAETNPWRIAPLLYATASGQRAFQHPSPSEGLTLFGRALLDGLMGQPDIELECADESCAVRLYPLHGFLKRRVMEQLKAAQEPAVQPVRLSGIVDDEAITFVPAGVRGPAAPQPRRSMTPGPHGMPPPSAGAENFQTLLDESFEVTRSVKSPFAYAGWARDFDVGHDLFAHETVTDIFSHRLRVTALGRQDELPPERLELSRVDRDAGGSSYRVHLAVDDDDRRGHLLTLVDHADIAHACVLPRDLHLRPIFLIEADFRPDDRGRVVCTRLEAALAPESEDLLGAAAVLWERYRASHVGEAVAAFELSDLREMVRAKLDSPLAATVGGLILLRAHREDLLADWLRNLSDWFEHLPDGAVLWAEQLMRRPGDHIAEAAEHLLRLERRGLPMTAEALAYAARLQPRLLPDHRLAAALRRAIVTLRPGGLFASFSGRPGELSPGPLFGPLEA